MSSGLEMEGGRRTHEDLAAERAVLGAILADNAVMADVGKIVDADDFSSLAHQQIFAAMLGLDSVRRVVDPLTLSEELKVRGHLAAIGGPAYLMGLDQVVPLASNAGQYAQIVKDQSIRRRLAMVGKEIQQLASQDTGQLADLLDQAEQRVFQIAEKKRVGELRPVRELMERTLELLDKMKLASTGITGISTGYVDLDQQLTGLHGGELIVLAARPGIGKTSLAMNIAVHIAMEEKKPVGIFSLEMPADQLLMRLLAATARVDMKKLRGGRLTQLDEQKFSSVAADLYNAPLYIDDTGSLSPFDLRSKARRLKQRDGQLGLIVIDYLQLMHLKGAESRQLEISEISRGLKSLAKELDCPILALSQLNRKVEERKGGQPMLSDLRESGAIEQDADVVMFIHRPDDDGGDEGAPPEASGGRAVIPVELIVAKQRNGPTGTIDLVFLAEFTKFESRARGDWQ